ncbi:MAG: hypothetical protein HY939_03880 [Gammaproteobacteria bacterium]|nr:hypothetical protein [Gammaproteobacteria bacterium]
MPAPEEQPNDITALHDFSARCTALLKILQDQYAAIQLLNKDLHPSQQKALQHLPTALEQTQQNITDLATETDSFIQPSYEPEAEKLTWLRHTQEKYAATQEKLRSKAQEKENLQLQLTTELDQFRRDVETKRNERSAKLTELDIQMGNQVRQQKDLIETIQGRINQELEGCCASCFPCLNSTLKKLRVQEREAQTQLTQIQDEARTLGQHPDIIQIDANITSLLETIQRKEIALQLEPQKIADEIQHLENILFKYSGPLSELKAYIETNTNKICFAIDNRRMFFCVRAYETLLSLEKTALELCCFQFSPQPTEVHPEINVAPNIQTKIVTLLMEFAQTIKKALLSLLDEILTHLFTPLSRDCEGDYFLNRYNTLSEAEKNQVLGASPGDDTINKLIPPRTGQILREGQIHITGLTPLPETPRPLPPILAEHSQGSSLNIRPAAA